MGNCCAQKDDVDVSQSKNKHQKSDKGNKDNLPSPIVRKIDAKKQRRRLSAAPEHVGDIGGSSSPREKSTFLRSRSQSYSSRTTKEILESVKKDMSHTIKTK